MFSVILCGGGFYCLFHALSTSENSALFLLALLLFKYDEQLA